MKKIIIGVLLVVSSSVFYSCEDFLNVTPRDILVEDGAFQSLADLEAGTIGVYAALSYTNLIDLSSRMGDNLQLGGENRGQGRQTHDWAFNSGTGEASGIWNNLYGSIARLNRVLFNIDRLIDEGVVTADETNVLKGELLAIRAMQHFDLWRVFSEKYNPSARGVAYMSLEDLDGNGRPDGLDPDATPVRQTTEFLIGRINQDLAEARNLLPEVTENVFRMNQTAVIALQARVALYSEQYADAVTHATTVLGRINLAAAADYSGIWTDANNEEVILAWRRIPGDGRIGTLFTDLNGDRFFQPAEGIVDVYDAANDIRFARTIGFKANGDIIVNKYPGTAGNVALNNVKVLRAAEMLLIAAEAKAWQNQIANGTSDLNTLRAARINGYTDQTFADRDALLAAIEVERRRELAYEGHRWFDLKRWGRDLDRDPRDCVSGAIPCVIQSTDYRWRFPIPQAEIFANPNMEQNDGYTDEE
jgi:starch-binding outer membrane protein, SusD/RagB family